MPTPFPTEAEILETLKRSSLPTVVVEGTGDLRIYRWIESRLGNLGADLLPVNGRDKLLSLYRRRTEIGALAVSWLADRDMWVFGALPDEYVGVIFTSGYSIENDVYVDAKVEDLLNKQERAEHASLLSEVIKWMAFEVEMFRDGREHRIASHINQVFGESGFTLRGAFATERGFREPAEETVNEIRLDYRLKVRGKTLFDVLLRFLSAPNRDTKYSRNALVEIAVKLTSQSPVIEGLLEAIMADLAQFAGETRHP
jgi:hypothetical protein